MAITVNIDMKYTRPGEATESNVLSAHNPLIWLFRDNAIAANPTATIQFVAKNNIDATIYTSAVFSCYLLSYGGGTAVFQFDATQIIKHIINNYFYKEISEIIDPENYGSKITVTIKTYDDAVLEDTEVLTYFTSQAVNQIGDEYGANIPRLFYNDTEEIAHFLGYPTKIFFYLATDRSAHSPLIEIIDRDTVESTNLITTLTNNGYNTFTVVGTSLTSVIETVSAGQGRSSNFAIAEGQTYLVLVPGLTWTSGELPFFYLYDLVSPGDISTRLRGIVGDNAFVLKSSATTISGVLVVENEAVCNWQCGPIQVIPVEDASDYGSLKIANHCVDLGLLALSKKSIYARVYYDHDEPIKIKDYNLYIFEPCENAIFIRWLNSNGDYSYWAFSPYPFRDKSGDRLGSVINNFTEMALANSRNLPLGYRDAFDKISVIASAVPLLFRRKMLEIFTSPAVYLWNGLPSENLITTGFYNHATNKWETLITDGIIIISAINTAGTAYMYSSAPYFAVSQGEIIQISFDLNHNSGELPSFRLAEVGGGAISVAVVAAAGFNSLEMIATADGPVSQLMINVATDSNFSTSAIIVKRKEIELDWILLDRVEGSHNLREKREHDNFECILVLPENYTQQLSGQNI